MKKKILALFTAAGLILSTLPTYAFSTESGTCGKNLTWTLADGVLTISGTGDMEDYEHPEADRPPAKWTSKIPWKWYISNIKSIVVEEGVTSIGNYAFYDCDNAVSLSLPDTLTDIGEYAFEFCDGLTFISLPESITSIGRGAFDSCFELTAINLPKNLTRIEPYLFGGCESLISVNIPETVTYIGDGAFSCCSVLTGVTLPDGISEINDYTFEGCMGLTDIQIPDTVTRIGDYAFSEAELTSIEIPDAVTSIGECAFSFSEFESVTIPESVTSIGAGAFSNCHYLADITYPKTVELGLGVFGGTEFERNLPKDEYGVTYFNNRLVASETTLTGEYTVHYGTTALEGDAFWWNSELESVILPDTVKYIGGFAFGMCKKLKSIHIPDSVTEIDIYAFKGCENLESIYIPASVKRIGRKAFSGCDKLKDIYYEGSEKQWNEITTEFMGIAGDENAKHHFNCEPIANPVTPEPDNTIEDTIINYGPESIVKPIDGGYILDLNIYKTDYCSKVIAAHYKGGKLINVETKAPTSPIVSFNIAADTDEIKVWTFKDKLEYADAVDVKFLTMVLNETE